MIGFTVQKRDVIFVQESKATNWNNMVNWSITMANIRVPMSFVILLDIRRKTSICISKSIQCDLLNVFRINAQYQNAIQAFYHWRNWKGIYVSIIIIFDNVNFVHFVMYKNIITRSILRFGVPTFINNMIGNTCTLLIQNPEKNHFRVKDFKCDQCDAEFTSVGKLNWHYTIHEGATYRQGSRSSKCSFRTTDSFISVLQTTKI